MTEVIIISQSQKMYVTAKQKRDDTAFLKAKLDSKCSVYNTTIRVTYNACMWFNSALDVMIYYLWKNAFFTKDKISRALLQKI